MLNIKMLSTALVAIDEDSIINFEFIFDKLTLMYNALNAAWTVLAAPFDAGIYDIMLEIGMPEEISQGIQNAVSNSFFGSWSPLGLVLGLSIPVLVLLEIIKYVKSLIAK